MKKITLSIVCSLLVITHILYAGSAVDGVIPPDVEACLKDAWVTDPDALQAEPACEEKLRKFMQLHWQDVFRHWNEVATTDDRRWVFLCLCQSLDARDYMSSLEAVVDLRKKGQITAHMFEETVLLPSAQKEGFLALNYQEPRVQAYIKSIRGLAFKDDQEILDEILSGKTGEYFRGQHSVDEVPIGRDLLLSPGKGK
jgi:hypothetical protein